ncbi:MAG: RDD family protein [Candidatus Moranbacteria bacterium]|nr:RDD family protein [Candidatus Moranbacteria bacterium]
MIKRNHRYAGFWIRFPAFLLDALIVGIIGGILLSPLDLFDDNYFDFLFNLMMFGLVMAYNVLLIHYWNGQTIGKKAMNIKVVAKEGKLDLSKILLRETLGKFISEAILGIGYIMAGFTDKKRALHDYLGDTYVVYKD